MGAFFSAAWESILNFLANYNWITDTLDIVIVAFAIYSLIRLVRDSRAEQLLKGFFLLALAYGFAYLFNLTTLKYLLQIVFDNALILLVVIFQPEIRRVLEQVGSKVFGKIIGHQTNASQTERAITETVEAFSSMSRDHIGALG